MSTLQIFKPMAAGICTAYYIVFWDFFFYVINVNAVITVTDIPIIILLIEQNNKY